MGENDTTNCTTNTTVAPVSDWHVNATLAEILSLGFLYPTKELTEVLASGEFAQALDEVCAAAGIVCDVTPLAAYEGCDAEALLHTLRAEATRLFIGSPEPLVSPYEGVWAAHDNDVQPLLFVNPSSMAVERFMHTCGLGQKEGKNEPLDHIGTELELLCYLASIEAGIALLPEGRTQADFPGNSTQAAYHEFMQEHFLVWASRFAQETANQTRESFYRVMAGALGEYATQN